MKDELVPFGKYKGQPVEQLQNDREYTKWLLSQDWFNSRYSNIRTLIINNFKEEAESPEHNKLQAKFLDRTFAISVISAALNLPDWNSWISAEVEPLRHMDGFESHAYYKCIFEHAGWDVCLAIFADAFNHAKGWRSHSTCWGGNLQIELKPNVGEDFPAILRQIKSRNSSMLISGGGVQNKSVLIYENWSLESVSIDEVKEMYASSGIGMLSTEDIEYIELPDCFKKGSAE
jgi:hypothetical protein